MRSLAVIIFLGIVAPLAAQTEVKLPNGSADLGTQINAAAASLPANGGKILLESQANGQCYSFSVPIVITTPIILQGQGPSTCLSFVGGGTAVTFAGGSSGIAPGGLVDGFGLRDLVLNGSGSSGSQTGLLLGGNANTVGFYATGVTIANFGLGLQFGRGVWNFKMEHSIFNMNGQNVHWASSLHFGGENMDFDSVTFIGSGSTFANSVEFDDNITTDFSNLNNLTLVSCNFDSAQLVINNGAGGIRLYSNHFENPSGSGTEPFVKISAYTAGTDVVMDGPDFYNDQSNPYPPAFVEIDGGAIVTITQIRSINLDGSQNVPTNVVVSGWATVTLVGSSQLRAAQTQYTIVPGSTPTVRDIADWANDGQTKTASATAMYDSSGDQIQNGHITSGKVILPASGTATVGFAGASAFTSTPACTVSYQTGSQLTQALPLSANENPGEIAIYGQPYVGVFFQCVGN
jgi:hypothetical protein